MPIAAAAILSSAVANADDAQVARGSYLVRLGGCGDCHTPGYFHGRPDPARMLSGSDVGFEVPGVGIFIGPNLTPDKDTGLGTWSREDIVTAIQTGVRPDGRILSPIMPWRALAGLTADDAQAIAAYLKSLPPIRHAVSEPQAPGDPSTPAVVRLVATEAPPDAPADATHPAPAP
jgi:mono/diheme cytochrome c family protein